MKRTVALLAAAGLAAAASAQSVEIEPAAATVAPGEAVRLTVYGDPGPTDDALAGINFRVDATGGEWADHRHHIGPTLAPGPALDPGTIVGSSVIGIRLGQLTPLFGFDPVPGRIRLWSADFSSAAEGVFDISTTTSRMEVYERGRPDPWSRRAVTPTEGRAQVTVIPASGQPRAAGARRFRRAPPARKDHGGIAMNRKITVIATLAAAPIAAGQSWDFELSDPVLSPDSPSTTVTLFADVDPSEWLAGALLDVHASEEGWSDLKVRIPSSAAPRIALKAGEIRGAIVEGIVVGQLECIFGYSPDPGRIPVWEANFNVTDFAERTVDLATETERLDVYVEFCSYPGRVETRIPAEGGAMIEVIPAPGSLALLALGAVGALRRRRNIKETER